MAMRINAGELNKRIEILREERTEDKDGYGAADPDVIWRCWARFSESSGTELVRANADFGSAKVRFLIRWPAVALDRKMIVRYAGRKYPIEYINHYGDSRTYVELWCSRETKEGR